jgi:hypothetical protein
MKFRQKSKTFTKKRKRDYVAGEWTKASHKRMAEEKYNKYDEKEIS